MCNSRVKKRPNYLSENVEVQLLFTKFERRKRGD